MARCKPLWVALSYSCAYSLAATGRRINVDVVVCCIVSLENLGLDLVEGLDHRGVNCFEFLVVQGGER